MINDPASPTPSSAPHTDAPAAAVGARTFGEFVALLEDGRLAADLQDALKELAQACGDHALATMTTAKAKLALTFGFELKGGVFEIVADFKTTLPRQPRARSVAWTTRDGAFSPHNPRQLAMPFGVREMRDVSATRDLRPL